MEKVCRYNQRIVLRAALPITITVDGTAQIVALNLNQMKIE